MNNNSKTLIESIITNQGINVQAIGTEKPEPISCTIQLYLISKIHGLKQFKIDETLTSLMNRKTYGCAFGTTTNDQKDKVGIVLVWE